MIRHFAFCLILLASPALAQVPRNGWDDHPGIDFDPRSLAEAPCGHGTPPRGHVPSEVSPAGRPAGLDLVVRQDAHRLCYVADGIAEAPVIRIRQGQELAITLTNEISDPGAIDRVTAVTARPAPLAPVPAAPGYLPVVAGARHPATGATNLHVHGFAVPPVAPADEVMMTCADPATGSAGCGRRTVHYRYPIPADMPAGLYWYHPHVHGEVQAQMMLGLSGAIVVEGKDDDARRAAGIDDRIFVIRQVQDIEPAPGPATPAPAPPASHPPRPAPASGEAVDTDHEVACTDNTGVDRISLNGAKVIDGHVRDVDLAPVQMPAGSIELWRVLNAATDSYLSLAVVDQTGMPVPLRITARDGAPVTDDAGRRADGPGVTDYQLVPPAGRLEFLVAAPPPGEKAYFISKRVDTGCTGDHVPERKLALITAGPPKAGPQPGPAAASAAFLPATDRDRFSGLLAEPTRTVRRIVMAEYPRPGIDDQNDFLIAEAKPGAVLKPFTMGGPPTITTEAGAVEEWVVENWTNELHAFHIHQVHFRVLEINGHRLDDPPLMDTISVPFATPADVTEGAAAPVPGRVRIKLEFPAALAGDILFHCHLVDHEDAGMMGVVRVLPPDGATPVRKAELTGAGATAIDFERPPICRPPAVTEALADRVALAQRIE